MPVEDVVSMKSLLEAGVHFGHRTRRWNPKMKPYIFTERNGIHIIDLQQTIKRLGDAYELVKDTVASGGVMLFVGTKKQAQESIAQEAMRCGMPFVNQRWLGGTLTNWRTIRQRIDYLLEIEKQQARGEFARLIKKEALMREREIARLNYRLGGLKEMRRLPNLLFVVDIRRDAIAVKEANILGIPVIAMVDTNCDPDPIDYVVPSNDDAIRALKLMNLAMSTAVLEGRAILNTLRAEEEEAATLEEDEAMERYLGPSTLAKLQAESDEEAETGAEEAPQEKVRAQEPSTEAAAAEQLPEGEPAPADVVETVAGVSAAAADEAQTDEAQTDVGEEEAPAEAVEATTAEVEATAASTEEEKPVEAAPEAATTEAAAEESSPAGEEEETGEASVEEIAEEAAEKA